MFLRQAALIGQGVLKDLVVLHDDLEVSGRVGDQVEVVQRIAVDQKKVGERALLYEGGRPRIGIAEAGEAEQPGICRCRHY